VDEEPIEGFFIILLVNSMPFPLNRMRRTRQTERLRSMVRETRLEADAMIYPIFVCPGENVRREIPSMPGQYNLSVDRAVEAAREAEKAGVGGLLIFGIPESKDDVGSGAYAEDGIVQRALRAIRQNVSDLVLIGDVCLCEYTSHGHCGVVRDGEIQNDPSLDLLARTALSQVQAGADVVAPSDMMDGRVIAIRTRLDGSGFNNVPIMSYAAKYASVFYGPFRDAAGSSPQFGDRRTHQMDPANVREAMREIRLDLEEGADIAIVKPAMPYLDVIRAARDSFEAPIAAYQVSGEYAMIEAAARNGWLDRDRAIVESLTGIRRAGAGIIITYYALEMAARESAL
jgi:porphobilinogen synthase